ncbi:chitooligosaccharidolytic beta-N-acetylglucosaminidase-like [Plodia interpunctella]|uniref:chitooligosaccharidolytic beta-N-acetylglucosaminidase-like n=1 Tax=Plodia interpunctella TaxID=58824 RepID=UPI002368CBD8|nr:chitooligosaccharidolytic beta-N-acetylglucosaminidase-like [Plodia interpunctella]
MWSIIFLVTFYITSSYCDEPTALWHWTCNYGKCIKMRTDPKISDLALNLEACKMICTKFGLLWPRPRGEVKLDDVLSKVSLKRLRVVNIKRGFSDSLINKAVDRFKNLIRQSIPGKVRPKGTGSSVVIYLFNNNPDTTAISLTMNESYSLNVRATSKDHINVTVTGDSFFGLRHGLETLSQLFVYNDISDHVLLTRDVTINDSPVYPFRGLLLDTARHFYPVASIKRTIDAMAVVKMNTFHWHITDSQSFPFESTRRPNLTKLGTDSPAKTYSVSDMKEIVQYALERGVRVLPEFDAPAHVGEGWQDSNLLMCFKAEPWYKYCNGPPCGQLNPIKEELYQYLEDIYMDMADVFDPDIFHMGGDEVNEDCWMTSPDIQQFMIKTQFSFLKLWHFFQKKAQKIAYKAFGTGTQLILWTSKLTDSSTIEKYLSKNEYIIQVWDAKDNPLIKTLLKKGYRLILTNYDALYLDCGYGAWIGGGLNWCAPYIPWQQVYDFSPAKVAGDYKKLVIGAEAALWSEQTDAGMLDGRVWPRVAALAERLWAEPSGWRQAERRMEHVRERLVRMGVQAETLKPEWCYQNEGFCH